MKALALLTLRPDDRQVDFYRGLEADGYDLFVFVDDPGFQPVRDDVRYVLIDDGECANAGFYDFCPMFLKPSRVCTWDKAVYFFARLNPVRYEHVWLIEDDVFVPTLGAISALDRKYPGADIVSADTTLNTTGNPQGWFWWKFVPAELLPAPWLMSMVCAVRLKPTVFALLAGLVGRWKSVYGVPDGGPLVLKDGLPDWKPLLFIEYVFHTLALHAGLSVVVAEELAGIHYRREWTLEEMAADCLYHPVKELDLQVEYRRRWTSDPD